MKHSWMRITWVFNMKWSHTIDTSHLVLPFVFASTFSGFAVSCTETLRIVFVLPFLRLHDNLTANATVSIASLHICHPVVIAQCQSYSTFIYWIQSVILRRIKFNEKLIFSRCLRMMSVQCVETRMWLLSYEHRIYFVIKCCKFIVNCGF